jgi:hypothetical protein
MKYTNTRASKIASCENKYSMLESLPENFLREVKGSPNLTVESSYHFVNYGNRRGRTKSRNGSTPHYMGNMVHQANSIQHEIQYDQKCVQNVNNIPTIINGQLNFSKQQNTSDNAINKWGQVRNLVKESKIKIFENRTKYLNSNKHKILIIGDSHVRGCAARMIASLDIRFEVCGVINPGSSTESLNEIMKEEVCNLTANYFLVISSGSNDISRNDSRVAFRNMVNYIENVKHTNVILVCVPFR